jgi:hypothetical protein
MYKRKYRSMQKRKKSERVTTGIARGTVVENMTPSMTTKMLYESVSARNDGTTDRHTSTSTPLARAAVQSTSVVRAMGARWAADSGEGMRSPRDTCSGAPASGSPSS